MKWAYICLAYITAQQGEHQNYVVSGFMSELHLINSIPALPSGKPKCASTPRIPKILGNFEGCTRTEQQNTPPILFLCNLMHLKTKIIKNIFKFIFLKTITADNRH